jgi:uncharacterized RDD family membrane protein YckC
MLGVMNAIAHAPAPPARGPKLDNRRVLAGVVDLVIVALGAAVVLFAGDAATGDASDVQGALGAVVLGWALYYFFALESGDGQTVGKKLMKLRVVRADGSPVGMREVAVRTVLRVVDNYLVGLIVMLATGDRRQRIGDLAAGTIVVDASGPAVLAPAPMPAVDPDEAVDADEPVEETEPIVAETPTITLPARPSPPATVADLAAPVAPAATEVPELLPFPPVDEPMAEEPVEVEPVAEEPVEDEPVVEPVPVAVEPIEDEPVVEPVPVAVEPVEYEAPAVEVEPFVEDEPALEENADEELPDIASASIQELAGDVAAAHAVPVPVEPVEAEVEVEPASVEVDADEDADDEPVTVKSVETVSAIDLIMGGAAEDEGSDESRQDAEDSASQ